MTQKAGPIGVFDSGYGGLTVFKEIAKALPNHDFIYLGDNARVPYGTRSFETVYQYTRQCVEHLFNLNCNLVVLACNTASAKALRNIQQNDLPKRSDLRRVLGVIRPTTEVLGKLSTTKHVGLFATSGTVNSQSYIIESKKFFPDVTIYQEACPMWVPLVENNEFDSPGADYFIEKHVDALMKQSSSIDTILLACTHYPLLTHKIKKYLPKDVRLIAQGEIVANSLVDYLKRHTEIEDLCTKKGLTKFFTTESTEDFNTKAKLFIDRKIEAEFLQL